MQRHCTRKIQTGSSIRWSEAKGKPKEDERLRVRRRHHLQRIWFSRALCIATISDIMYREKICTHHPSPLVFQETTSLKEVSSRGRDRDSQRTESVNEDKVKWKCRQRQTYRQRMDRRARDSKTKEESRRDITHVPFPPFQMHLVLLSSSIGSNVCVSQRQIGGLRVTVSDLRPRLRLR